MSDAVPTGAAPTETSSCELADIVQRYGDAYAGRHPLRAAQRKALWAIRHCRTAVLGGHREWCPVCGFERYVYYSCRNRHCPKCQSQDSAEWVTARQEELLPVPYFHNVFTLPHDFNALILFSERNQRALLKLLFDAAAQTLLTFGRTELGGKIGFTLVLHTWDQRLRAHFHVHALIASGALAEDGSRWIAGGAKFLFPVHGLSKMFRAKFLDGLAKLLQTNALDIPPQRAGLAQPDARSRWLGRHRTKPWVVYSKAPFAGPRKLLDYLGRYTHRTAISRAPPAGWSRLLSCEDGQVTYRYRDRTDGDRLKTDVLPAEKFLRRFLQHILPDRFLRIRHYGLFANCVKAKHLARCRELLGVRPSPPSEDRPSSTAGPTFGRCPLQVVLGIDSTRCPCCCGPLRRDIVKPAPTPIVHRLLRSPATHAPPRDTS